MFLADEITGVDLRSKGGTLPTVGGRTRAPFLPPRLQSLPLPSSTVRPPRLRQFPGKLSPGGAGPRDQPPGESGGAVARGGGDDHASEARGAAAGAPDPVGAVLLRRARRLLAQSPHRFQEGSQGCSHLCCLVLFSHGVMLCCSLLEMVQTFGHVCNFWNSSPSESQNL